MSLPEYPLAEILTLEDGRTVEWEAVTSLRVEGGPGFCAHLARPDMRLVSHFFRCHPVNAPGCGRTSPPTGVSGTPCPGSLPSSRRFANGSVFGG